MSKNRITKTELVTRLAKRTGLKKTVIQDCFNNLSDLAVKEVKKNGELVIPGFGKLVKVERNARVGRNPSTGESIAIPAKATVKFRLSKIRKTAMSDPVTPDNARVIFAKVAGVFPPNPVTKDDAVIGDDPLDSGNPNPVTENDP